MREWLLSRLQHRFADHPPSLRLVFWDGAVFDFAERPRVTLTIASPSVIRSFLTGRIDRLGDAYVAGEILVDGAAEDIIHVGIDIAERLGRAAWLSRLGWVLKRFPVRHSPRADADAIRQHYDVSNEFFRLWLDESMTYSCAYFRSGTEDIHTAQLQKLDLICRKLQLRRGDRILDIGCGWGGLLCHAARHYGVSGVGITNSPSQHRYAARRIAEECLADKIDIQLADYRDLTNDAQFDKIVSVGMYEHVGLMNMHRYFDVIGRLLKPGGALLNQGIIVTDPDGKAKGPPGGEFIDRYVFPGGELPHLPQVLDRIARSRLETVDVEDLRPHYAQTLLHWVRRLEARAAEARAAAEPECYRIWRIYLAGMAHAFDVGWLSVAQILAYKPAGGRPAPRAWSRYGGNWPDLEGATAKALDWRSA